MNNNRYKGKCPSCGAAPRKSQTVTGKVVSIVVIALRLLKIFYDGDEPPFSDIEVTKEPFIIDEQDADDAFMDIEVEKEDSGS